MNESIYGGAAKEEFGINLPVYITENGVGFAEEREENGMINDAERIRYLKGSFASLRRALSEGIDVRGYYLWSLWITLNGRRDTL